MTVSEKSAYLKTIIYVAAADGAISDSEQQAILDYGTALGMKTSDLIDMLYHVEDIDFKETLSNITGMASKKKLVTDLITFCYADGAYTKSEKRGIEIICVHIGINDATRDYLEKKVANSFSSDSIFDNLGDMHKVLKGQRSKKNAVASGLGKLEKKEKVNLDEDLKAEINRYNCVYADLSNAGMALHITRERSSDLIGHVENLINSIANHPKSIDSEIAEIKVEKQSFKNTCDYAAREAEATRKSASGTVAGAATGTAVAALAPTAAMWVATTFGTASTGTAISALSGAAATKAALAWIGGGALAAGGGGAAAGEALLALAGPVGWSIAGATILASVVVIARNRHKADKEKMEEISKIKANTEKLLESQAKIELMLRKTMSMMQGLQTQYYDCLIAYAKRYPEIDRDHQLALGTLVNNTNALAKSLSENLTNEADK